MNQNEHLDALKDIKLMMEKSTKFLSLSGISGFFAGVYALIAASLVYFHSGDFKYDEMRYTYGDNYYYLLIAVVTLFLTIITSFLFTFRKAKKQNESVFSKVGLLAIANLGIPLVAGGIFCLALIYHHLVGLLAPATLVFYGLALINASKYTYIQIRHLGILEVSLGLVSLFVLGYGLLFWAIGFGLLHVIYGLVMYFKYEKNN